MFARFWSVRLIVVLVLSLAANVAHAQTGLGVVRGVVQDASGAVAPGARIQLLNTATGVSHEAKSGPEGIFYFGSIQPGPYTLSVEADGFKKWSGELTVEVGQTVAIDPKLAVGTSSTVVEVTAAAPVITTVGAQISDVKDSQRISQLPLNGRDITNLFNLTPGVEGGGAPRVNGSKVGATEMLQDGVTMVDRFMGGVQRVRAGLETVQEFRIETSGSNARFSRPSTVQIFTKSGTNLFHGSLFETFRNNGAGLRARQRQDGTKSAFLNRNEFGGSASGPVYLPGIYNGKNKSFWFATYEGQRQRQQVFDQEVVPTAQLWSGDFSTILDNNGKQTHIYDPLTTDAAGARTMFPGDIIPQSRISKYYGVLKSITHAPTNDLNPFQANNMLAYYPVKNNIDTVTVKGDQRFGDKDSLSGRFTRSRANNSQPGGRYGAPDPSVTNAYGTSSEDNRLYSLALNEIHTFRPNLVGEFLAVVMRNPNSQGTLADYTMWAEKLGFPNPFGAPGWPTISVAGGSWSWDANNHKDQKLTSYHLEENLTWIRGKHTFQFGGSARREENNVREMQQAQGSHSFGIDWTALYDPIGNQQQSYTGNGLASMALGLPTQLSAQYNRGYFYLQQYNTGLYFQDTWKLTRKLTLEAGLRWEKWTPYHEKLNRLVNVDLNNYATGMQVITPAGHSMESLQGIPPSLLASWAARGMTWKTADAAGFPGALTPAVNTDFGPRLGFAYQINEKTVIRGGYGRYFWTMPLSQILQTSRTNPPLNLRYYNQLGNLDGTGTTALRLAPKPEYYTGAVQLDISGSTSTQCQNNACGFMPWDARNWKDDMLQSWQFTIERELMKNTALKLVYIGNHGSNLEQRFNIDSKESQIGYINRTGQNVPSATDQLRVNPNWAFDAANHTGYSNTHSAQVEVERRFSRGLSLQWFYTFTRSLNTTDAGNSSSGGGGINDTAGGFVVPENIQILGEPNLSYDQRLRLGYYNSTAIPAQRMRWNGIWDIPVGRGKPLLKNAGGLVNHILGGWQLSGSGSWSGGSWLSVPSSEYLFGDPSLSPDQRLLLTYNGKPQRLYFAGDFDPTKATNVDMAKLTALVPMDRNQRLMRPLGTAFDNRLPVALANGTVRMTSITDTVAWNARAFMMGNRSWNQDLSLFKNFRFNERYGARFTADFFNCFNHPNDSGPNSTTGMQDLSTQSNDPRIIQFSLRLSW